MTRTHAPHTYVRRIRNISRNISGRDDGPTVYVYTYWDMALYVGVPGPRRPPIEASGSTMPGKIEPDRGQAFCHAKSQAEETPAPARPLAPSLDGRTGQIGRRARALSIRRHLRRGCPRGDTDRASPSSPGVLMRQYHDGLRRSVYPLARTHARTAGSRRATALPIGRRGGRRAGRPGGPGRGGRPRASWHSRAGAARATPTTGPAFFQAPTVSRCRPAAAARVETGEAGGRWRPACRFAPVPYTNGSSSLSLCPGDISTALPLPRSTPHHTGRALLVPACLPPCPPFPRRSRQDPHAVVVVVARG